MMTHPLIVVIDDDINVNDVLLVRLKIHFSEVMLFKSPHEGVRFCQDCISQGRSLVVILDFKFESFTGYTGEVLLEQIRKFSKLVPVIIRSAYVGTELIDKSMINFINLKTFGVFRKNEVKPTVEKVVEAVEKVNSSVEGALEEWLVLEQERNKLTPQNPYIIQVDGKQFTIEEILKEIRMESSFGLKTKKDLEMLTIDLLLRGKENL